MSGRIKTLVKEALKLEPQPMLQIAFYANVGSNLTCTNLAAALTFLKASAQTGARLVDASRFTEVRLNVMTSSAAAAAGTKFLARYRTRAQGFDATEANWTQLGLAEEVIVTYSAINTMHTSAWIPLATAARADILVVPMTQDGDGVADPTLGSFSLQFR